MAWTAPMTAVDGTVLTAADWNTYVRDNLLETAVAKATTAGRYFVTTGQNTVEERAIASASVNTSDVTTSTSYGDLDDTEGPSVTVTASNFVMVGWSAQIGGSGVAAGAVGYVGVDISGAQTFAAWDTQAIIQEVSVASDTYRVGVVETFGAVPGESTLKLVYRSGGGGTVRFQRRSMWVMPL